MKTWDQAQRWRRKRAEDRFHAAVRPGSALAGIAVQLYKDVYKPGVTNLWFVMERQALYHGLSGQPDRFA